MIEKHYIVIGNGPAGLAAAQTLRECESEARITVLSRDRHSHYQPRLLPDYIAGKVKLDQVASTPYSFYEEHRIRLRTGQCVVGVDPDARTVFLEHKEHIRFDGLVVAVGGRPRIPEPYWVFQDLMLPLKNISDADKWIGALSSVDTVLIVGGDLTSFSISRALLDMGKKVRFIFTDGAFWPMRPNNEIIEQAAARLAGRGVEVVEGRLRSISRTADGGFEAVTDKRTAEAGLVGAFFGLAPDVRFLAGSGLKVERGVLVDELLRTDYPYICAAGDCAQVYHPKLKDYWVSIGYDNALRLGRIAAINLAGGLEEAQAATESIFMDQGVRANTSWWMEF
jgi:NADPH-dependent 2,4-dienoyl-CoA reductase/sulfur reductase-like enzyme